MKYQGVSPKLMIDEGEFTNSEHEVFMWDDYIKERYKLPLYLEKIDHSPTGFAWGYEGSGPAQLAWALLYNVTGNEKRANTYYQKFKREKIAPLSIKKDWELTSEEITEWLTKETTNGN